MDGDETPGRGTLTRDRAALSLVASRTVAVSDAFAPVDPATLALHHHVAVAFGTVVFETDLDGRITIISAAIRALTGLRPEEIVGKPLADLVIPDDQAMVAARLPALLAGEDARLRHRARYRTIDGEMRWLLMRLTLRHGPDGRAAGSYGLIGDATHEVLQAQHVAESEARYRLLAEHSNDMIVRLGFDGVRRYVSPASRALLGYDPSELVGKTPAGAIHVDDRAGTIDACRRLLAGDRDPMCVYRQARKDGSWAWLEASYFLVRDPLTAEPIEFVASVRDVSRRQAAELAAAEAAARAREGARMLEMAESAAQAGHWRLDLIEQSLFWSTGVCRIHDVPIGHVPALNRAIDYYHPDDRAVVEAAVRRCAMDGTEYQLTARIVRASGDIRHVALRGQAERAPDGTIMSLFGIIQDVTEQALAQATLRERDDLYRLLADNATEAIFRLDRDWRFRYVSPGVVTLTGFDPERLIGTRPIDAIHPDDVDGVSRAFESLWAGSEERAVVSYRTRCADGSWHWLEASARRAAYAGTTEIIGVARDIQERKRIEDELIAARHAAEASAAEARQLAETDELTGLASRRRFLGALDRDVADAEATAAPLAVMIFDIDHFKTVNDRHGHAAGDETLRQVAAAVRRVVRDRDLIGRIGGEEFAVLLRGASPAEGERIGERLRRTVEEHRPADAALPCVTISVGLAQHRAGDDGSAVLADADAALYAAKNAGRNRLCIAPAERRSARDATAPRS